MRGARCEAQARKNRRCIRWNTLRIFSDRERRRWLRIVRRSRTTNVRQAPKFSRWRGKHEGAGNDTHGPAESILITVESNLIQTRLRVKRCSSREGLRSEAGASILEPRPSNAPASRGTRFRTISPRTVMNNPGWWDSPVECVSAFARLKREPIMFFYFGVYQKRK